MTDTAVYARLSSAAENLLDRFGVDITRTRYTNEAVDVDDPGGAQVRVATEATVMAAKFPMGADDIRSFGDLNLTGREEKVLVEPTADLKVEDTLTFGGREYRIKALTRIDPTESGSTMCLWKGVIVA
jgi:hypothetical protein